MASNSPFFEPWIGSDYQRLREQRDQGVLQPDVWAHPFHVLGESHYAELDEYEPGLTCRIIHECGFKASKCSRFFAKVLKVVTGKEIAGLNREEQWQKLAFSNYVQDVLTGPRREPSVEQWARGRDAFRAQLRATTPDVLLVLGQRLWDHLPRDFGFAVPELTSMDGTVQVKEAWAYVYEEGDAKRLSLAVYVIHPSAGGGAFKWRIAAERARTVLLYRSNILVSPEFEACPAVPL